MTPIVPHHLVSFAARHAIGGLKTFDAFSALWRAENLVDDAQRLLELKNNVDGLSLNLALTEGRMRSSRTLQSLL